MDATELLTPFRIVPVVVLNDPARAVELAERLRAHDLHCVEITLRTPRALACIEAVKTAQPSMTVGAGSVCFAPQIAEVRSAGADFGVSPGSTDALLTAADAGRFPFVPGAATATEVLGLLDRGYETVKFFPAELSGGLKMLRALAEPIPTVGFFPTGGIKETNFRDYLAFDRVRCIGGSWLAPAAELSAGDFHAIDARLTALR